MLLVSDRVVANFEAKHRPNFQSSGAKTPAEVEWLVWCSAGKGMVVGGCVRVRVWLAVARGVACVPVCLGACLPALPPACLPAPRRRA